MVWLVACCGCCFDLWFVGFRLWVLDLYSLCCFWSRSWVVVFGFCGFVGVMCVFFVVVWFWWVFGGFLLVSFCCYVFVLLFCGTIHPRATGACGRVWAAVGGVVFVMS